MASQEPPSFYQQHPVTLGARQTRLLHIQPATSHTDQLRASLLLHKLDNPSTAYETLSYVWGLASDLRYLRKPDRPLRIWIDAISINQQDKLEKADQVAIMGDIYRGATHVNIWLLHTFFSNIALTSSHFHAIPGFSTDPKTNRLTFSETPEFTAAWEGFRLVAESPWWTRAWTVQEAILPPKLNFLYGSAEPCGFQVMASAMDNYWRFGKHLDACCSEAMTLFPREKMDALGSILGMVGHVGNIFLRRSLGRGRDFDGRDCFYMVVRAFASRS
ncbi:heterokaryon incompatibility protein-domain-containing protein [Podospora aff. communis PSN243]|uniref:Heterokaryon incompatibility protein-domain-containing protein n=1 Tax=Podospora aff. communis PSN243 TaxID=3040156 RepID=A0AAV9GB24_9PEZI|nr:heterokaryon incompatibility protein-domain-containing protein [Podospora aff. communis PSN243]